MLMRLIKNQKGFSYIEAIITIALFATLAAGLGQILPGAYAALNDQQIGLKATAVAMSRWNELTYTTYAGLASEPRTQVDATDKLDREVVVTETDMGGGVLKKTIEINVYRTGDSNKLYTMTQSRLSNSYIIADYALVALTALDADTVDGKHASDFAPAGFGLGTESANISGKDLNNIYQTGFYSGNNVANAPLNSSDWHYFIVQRISGDTDTSRWVNQIAVNSSNGKRFQRQSRGGAGTWTSWEELTGTAGGGSGGKQLFDTPGTYTFTVPPGVTTVYVTLSGGGGCGGSGGGQSGSGATAGYYVAGSAGQPGQVKVAQKVTGLSPGQQIEVKVGKGGDNYVNPASPYLNLPGKAGEPSSFGAYVSAAGGAGGSGAYGGLSVDWSTRPPSARETTNGTPYGKGGMGGWPYRPDYGYPVTHDNGGKPGGNGFVLVEW